MGKSLIIKGADFSENGMKETVVTVDKSALYNNGGVQITAENVESQTSADASYNYIKKDGTLFGSGTDVGQKIFSSKFDAEDYETLVVTFVKVPGGNVGSQYWQFGIGFADANNVPIKAYTSNVDATGDKIVKVNDTFSGEIPIPSGTKWIYITDIVNATNLSNHSVVLKKSVIN